VSRQAKISIHCELYRYWSTKRGGRRMPRRRDIDPGDLPTLLPHLMLIDRAADQYRYRLVGTAVADELGRELTHQTVGSYVAEPQYAAAILGIYERVFAAGRPVFTTGEYHRKSGVIHAVSRLIVPLGEDDDAVNMVLLTRVARFGANFIAAADWLKGARGTVRSLVDVESLAALEGLGAEWERQIAVGRAAGLPQPAAR
jgi:hypothetical protein